MSFLEKPTLFSSGSVGRVLELGSKGRWLKLTGSIFFILCLSVLVQPRKTGKPPNMTDKLLHRTLGICVN